MYVPALRATDATPVTGPEQLPLRRTTGICAHCHRYTPRGRAQWATTCTGPDHRQIVYVADTVGDP